MSNNNPRGRYFIVAIAGIASAVSAWFLLVPFRSPRGSFLFGHHRLSDVVLGFLACLLAGPLWIRLLSGREAFLRTVLLVSSALFTLATVDVCFALFWRSFLSVNPLMAAQGIDPDGNLPDPELGYRRKPLTAWGGLFSTDENGFSNPRGLSRADIVFIGDSFTEAGSQGDLKPEETFVRIVGRKLGVSVANLGVGGWGPQQELAALRRFALAYKPRIVVWQLYEGNDPADAERYDQFIRGDPRLKVPLVRRFADNSLSVRLLARTIRTNDRHQFLRLGDGSELKLTLRGRYPDIASPGHRWPDGTGHALRALAAGQAFCEQNGLRLLVVTVPIAVRVLSDQLRFLNPAEAEQYLPGGVWDRPDDFDDLVDQECRKLGCTSVSLLAPLRDQARIEAKDVFIPNNDHLGRLGHLVTAEIIAAALDEGR